MQSESVVTIKSGWGEHIDTALKYAWKKYTESPNGSVVVASFNNARIIIVDDADEVILDAVRARSDEMIGGSSG